MKHLSSNNYDIYRNYFTAKMSVITAVLDSNLAAAQMSINEYERLYVYLENWFIVMWEWDMYF